MKDTMKIFAWNESIDSSPKLQSFEYEIPQKILYQQVFALITFYTPNAFCDTLILQKASEWESAHSNGISCGWSRYLPFPPPGLDSCAGCY